MKTFYTTIIAVYCVVAIGYCSDVVREAVHMVENAQFTFLMSLAPPVRLGQTRTLPVIEVNVNEGESK